MIDIALAIAKKAHAGQVDKAGIDYIQHPLYVASQVKTEQEKAVALLHDVIEDSDVTADDLLASGLSNEVVTAVQILTKKKGQSYQEYLEKVKSNNLARIVKLADLKHNSDLSRLKSVTNTDYERVKKWLFVNCSGLKSAKLEKGQNSSFLF
ncbi:metal dependent phosphohydrolase, HD region [Streptococcus pneumoniae]|nr:metal dependent phosphohydrolase, HD region [Streptococcus pneumoniae]SNG69296.1 metal dependent phosphohydrolase, HD region [Streptococcus pneumoniae]